MTLVSYWPAPGRLVPFPGPTDASLSSSGAQAAPTNYLTELVQLGYLRTQNPAGTAPAPVDYFQFAIYCTTLQSSVGVFGGQVIDVIGYRVKADGGQGQFTWDATSTLPANNGTIFGSQPVGRWVRVRAGNELNFKWFGCYGDNTHDDYLALQATFNAVTDQNTTIYMPQGSYCTTKNLILGTHILGPWGVRVHGEGAGYNGNLWPTIKWNGVSADKAGAMLYVNGFDHTFWQIRFSNETTDSTNVKQCAVSVGGGMSVASAGASHITFERCAFAGFEIGAAIDFDGILVNNLEICRWIECAFATFNVGLWVRDGQPYSTRVDRCVFNQNRPPWLSAGSGNPHGVAIRTGNPGDGNMSCSLWITDVNFSYMTYGLQMLGTPQAVHIQDVDTENTKKVLYQAGSGAQNCEVTLQAGRYDISAIYSSKPGLMYDFHEDVAGSDGAYIDVATANLNILGNSFFSGYFDTPLFKVKVGGCVNLTSIGNVYPTGNPFSRLSANVGGTAADGTSFAAFNGRTFSENDRAYGPANPYFAAGVLNTVNLPVLRGTENGPGVVTISGASTITAHVTLTNTEIAYNLSTGVVDYRVALTIQSATAGATISQVYANNISSTGFDVNVVTAPGASKSLVIAYQLYRD